MHTPRQDNTYHSLCYTSRGALAGTRNSSMGPPHEGSIRRPTAPWVNALPLSYVSLPRELKSCKSMIICLYLCHCSRLNWLNQYECHLFLQVLLLAACEESVAGLHVLVEVVTQRIGLDALGLAAAEHHRAVAHHVHAASLGHPPTQLVNFTLDASWPVLWKLKKLYIT